MLLAVVEREQLAEDLTTMNEARILNSRDEAEGRSKFRERDTRWDRE